MVRAFTLILKVNRKHNPNVLSLGDILHAVVFGSFKSKICMLRKILVKDCTTLVKLVKTVHDPGVLMVQWVKSVQ